MTIHRLHNDELPISISLVQKLVTDQFPEWSDLPLQVMDVQGTDNVMMQLGNDKVVRLPRTTQAAESLLKEHHWLPLLAPLLPLPIPLPLAKGAPAKGYPLPWLVYHKLDGDNPIEAGALNLHQAAIDLGEFVAAMHRIDPNGPDCYRGQPLSRRDAETRQGIAAMSQFYDAHRLTQEWESALAAPEWSGPPTWVHGDLHPANLLALDRRVSAVVDFGLMGVGDPASDLMVAWTLLSAESREIFRCKVQPDDATWGRGRGWALTLGVVAYPYYRTHNPTLAQIAKKTIDELLSEMS